MTVKKPTASARKSLGEYKPLVKFPDGSTKVIEQSEERAGTWNRESQAYIGGNAMARGTVYADRNDAIAAAQRWIDWRVECLEADLERFEEMHAAREDDFMLKGIESVRKQIAWFKGE